MVAHTLETRADCQIVAHVAHGRFIPSSWLNPYPVIAFEEILDHYPVGEYEIFVALEHARNNVARAQIAAEARSLGYRLFSFVDPSASLAKGVKVSEHCLVLGNVTAQFGVYIGENVIIGANCFFGQGATIGADSYFGSGVFVDRFAKIGRNCVVGSQVRIAEGVSIHEWTFLKSFQEVTVSIKRPTIIHSALRTPGHIVDRRQKKTDVL